MASGGKREGAGRKKGVPNRKTEALRERLTRLGCDYVEVLAMAVDNKLPCAVCRGTGKSKFQPHGGKRFSGERTCQSCWGSGLERIEPRLRTWAAAELLQYCEPKRKAIEVTGGDGGPIKHKITVEFIKPSAGSGSVPDRA